MKYVVEVGGKSVPVVLDGEVATVDGRSIRVGLKAVAGTPVQLVTIDGRQYRVVARRGARRGEYDLSLAGFTFAVEALDERTRAIRAVSGGKARQSGAANLIAPMPGLILRVAVAEGDVVSAGQGVVVMEAMKMENELRIGTAGRVKRIHVSIGSAVERGALLLELE